MDIVELRKKSSNELKETLKTTRRDLFNLRMQRGLGTPPKGHRFGEIRRQIARICTILKEQENSNE